MSATTLGIVLAFASYAALHGAARVVAASLARRRHDGEAGALFALAVLPTLAPLTIAIAVLLPAFLLHEPAGMDERPGIVLAVLAGLGMLHLAAVVARAVRLLVHSRALIRRWSTGARPLPADAWGLRAVAVDVGHPEVALAGILRPQLFIDRRVLEACSPGELQAIAAHERAHARAHDNLRRLLVDACNRRRDATARAWHRAAERAADAHAATTPAGGVELAAALLRVSRLMPVRRPHAAVVSGMYDGDLQARVRHLLSGAGGRARDCARPCALFALAALALAFLATRHTHALLEFVLHALP